MATKKTKKSSSVFKQSAQKISDQYSGPGEENEPEELGFDATNDSRSKAAFIERTEYRKSAYPSFVGFSSPIDMWYEKGLYGKVDEDYNPVITTGSWTIGVGDGTITTPTLKKLPSDADEVFAMNFVADAYSDLRDYIYQAANMGQYNITATKFLPLEPKAGWSSYPNQYRKYSNILYKSYGTDFLEVNQRASEVKSFTTFVNSFSGFLEDMMPEFPVTPSGFVLSKRYSPESTGLIIELIDAAHGDDKVKYEDVIQDPNFLFFVGAARQFGFMIDKNAPWRLVADIKSSKMQEYMSKYPEKPEDPGEPVAPDDPCVVAQDLFSEYLGEKIQFTSPTIINSDFSALGKIQEISCSATTPEQATFKIKTYCPGSDDDLLDSTSGARSDFQVVWPDASAQYDMMNGPSTLPDVTLSNYRRTTNLGNSPDLTVVGLFQSPVAVGEGGTHPPNWQPITWLNSDMSTQPFRTQADVAATRGSRNLPIEIERASGVDEFRWEVVDAPRVEFQGAFFGFEIAATTPTFVEFADPSRSLPTLPNSAGQPIAYSDSATASIRLKLGAELPGDYIIKVEGYDLSNPLVPRKVTTKFLTLRLRVFYEAGEYTIDDGAGGTRTETVSPNFPRGFSPIVEELESWDEAGANHWSLEETTHTTQRNNITVSEFYILLNTKLDEVWSTYQQDVRRSANYFFASGGKWITPVSFGLDLLPVTPGTPPLSDPRENWLFYFIKFLQYVNAADAPSGTSPLTWEDLYYKRFPVNQSTGNRDGTYSLAHSNMLSRVDERGGEGLTVSYNYWDVTFAIQFLSNVVRRTLNQRLHYTGQSQDYDVSPTPSNIENYWQYYEVSLWDLAPAYLLSASRIFENWAQQEWQPATGPALSVMDFIDRHGVNNNFLTTGTNLATPWTDNSIGTQGYQSPGTPYVDSNDMTFDEFIGPNSSTTTTARVDVPMNDIMSWLRSGAAVANVPSLWDFFAADPNNVFGDPALYKIVRDAYQALVNNTAYAIIQTPDIVDNAGDTAAEEAVPDTATYNVFVLLEQMATQTDMEFILAEKNNRAFQKKRIEYDRVIQDFLPLQEKYEAHVVAKNIYDAQLVQWNSIHDPVTLQHGGPLSFDNLFKRQFEYTSDIDLETIKKYFYNVYNSYALAVPLKTVPRINKSGDGVQLCMIERELISQQDIDALYPDSWWLNLYYILRIKESGRITTPSERRSFQSRLANLLSGIGAATSSQDRAKIMKQVAQLIHKETKGVIKEKRS